MKHTPDYWQWIRRQMRTLRYTPAYEDDITAQLAAAGGLGQSVFRYFQDHGVRAASLHGNNHVAELLSLWARYAGFPIESRLAGVDMAQTTFPRAPFRQNLRSLGKIRAQPDGVPIVLTEPLGMTALQQLQSLDADVYTAQMLLDYALYMGGLVDPLRAIAGRRPGVSLVFCNECYAMDVPNASENERYFAGVKLASMPADRREAVFDAVYRRHGHSDAYIEAVLEYCRTEERGGITFSTDISSPYVNAVGGFRITTDTPEHTRGTVYLLGNSITFGIGTDDAGTIASALQRRLNAGTSCPPRVLNAANMRGAGFLPIPPLLRYLDPAPGDTVVCMLMYPPIVWERLRQTEITCDVRPYLARPHALGEIYVDNSHMNALGYDRMAAALEDTLRARVYGQGAVQDIPNIQDTSYMQDTQCVGYVSTVRNTPTPPSRAQGAAALPSIRLSPEDSAALDAYIDSIRAKAAAAVDGPIGAVVMNCNPFTLGHRYLIEHAASRVGHLYLFVVEEDRSVFPFADRMALVRQGTADLPNVTVLPSGRFIISRRTFEAYFAKEEEKEAVIDATEDVAIFAERIAAALGITVRFVGEEPLCNITRQYNATMAAMLPRYGIALEILRRKGQGGAPISASRVRTLLKERRWDEIAALVPPSTLDYLRERRG